LVKSEYLSEIENQVADVSIRIRLYFLCTIYKTFLKLKRATNLK